ncbi:MAG TPA: 3-dehydroquinate dehydratase [Firmicutes bacterium]|nr:3-dehydroquinate dehydratase [Bacillota bacterium]
MIELTNVTKRYGQKVAVDDLSLTIKDGEILGLIGPNGAGKSTTLKMITGLTDITKGTILVDGYNIATQPLEAKQCFGFVMDSPDMFLQLKAIDFLTYVGNIYGYSGMELKSKILDYAHRLEIDNNLNQYIGTFSHGMRQKIMVLSALIHEPKTLILDEPMTGLDPKSQFTIKELMHEHVKSGHAVLFSTHVLDTAEKLCDRIAIINEGKLVCCGTLEELKSKTKDNNLEDIFLELTANEENK